MRDEAVGSGRLDRAALRRAFDRAAAGYDSAAALQADVRAELLARLDLVALAPRVVLDAGCATGESSLALRRRYPRARVIALDLSLAMLRAAGRRRSWWRRFDRLCADLERLPLADGSVDLVVSNLAPACCDCEALFAEVRRVLAPRGLFSFTSLGPDTLGELRRAWTRADALPHVHPFLDMHDLGDALLRAGFAQPVLDVERRTVTYAGVDALVADLRGSGARNALAGRARGLTGKGRARTMRAAYEQERRDGRLPATCEVVFAHAWAPQGPARTRGGEASFALEDLRRSLRAGAKR